MKILNRQQIRGADAFTIENEPISSVDLMERAGRACAHRIASLIPADDQVLILCGMGNNGGDGMVIADMLRKEKRKVDVRVIRHAEDRSQDHQHFADKTPWSYLNGVDELDKILSSKTIWIIDAILGSGQDRPLGGLLKECVKTVNDSPHPVIAVDIPTGLMTDGSDMDGSMMHCRHTVSFQFPKLGFLLPPQGEATESFEVLDIGLHSAYIQEVKTPFFFMDETAVRPLIRRRFTFSHKGDYGHVLLIAGSDNMAGAAVLSAQGALRIGAGKLSVRAADRVGWAIQNRLPEAMLDKGETPKGLTYVIGPGLGRQKQSMQRLIEALEENNKPLVLDADGLFLLAENKALWKSIPEFSILTPHPGEFARLTGMPYAGKKGMQAAMRFAQNKGVYLLVKGAYSAVYCPDGSVYFNASGNPAMAKGGSGDVLAGVIGGLLAQEYSPLEAAILGNFLHGKAGDLCTEQMGWLSVLATDICDHLGKALLSLIEEEPKG